LKTETLGFVKTNHTVTIKLIALISKNAELQF